MLKVLQQAKHRDHATCRASAIYFPPVSYSHYEHHEALILNSIDDPIIAHANAVQIIFGRQFDRAGRAGIVSQSFYPVPDAHRLFSRQAR